ncbi:isoprenoid synthase domain-containing protein [Xylaria telfairii]|nr:isoprenoid synthase domain-containing protein [Xylaria telfairii]
MPANLDEIKPLLVQFQNSLGYTGVDAKAGNDRCALFEGMHREAARMGIPYPEGSYAWQSFQAGANYACVCYPSLPLEVRIYAGIITWLAILVDKEGEEDPEAWHQFVPLFIAGGAKHHSNVARGWDRWLRLSYRLYSPVAANTIITSCLNFTNACAVEGSEMPKMTCTKGGGSWAYYIRDKNGMAETYSLISFPEAICPNHELYMEAIPDMVRYLCLVNDLFSFYKEECAMETRNYVRTRASYEGVGVYEVLRQIMEETVDAHHRIMLVLEGKEPYARYWNEHALGYVSYHTTSERYKLRDMGLDESLP